MRVEIMKICTKCKIEKELTEFSNRPDTKDGKQHLCKDCDAKQAKDYREANKEKIKARRDLRNKANKKKIAATRKAWREANKEKLKVINKAWREANKEKLKGKATVYYRANKEKLKKQVNARHSKRTKYDIAYRLEKNLRSRAKHAIKDQRTTKSAPTLDLIGSSVPFVRKWIESQFVDGMSWDNHGEWHIDHIRPCASFDLTDPEQQKECFNYKNLQPLWAEDNLSKGDRF